MQTSVYTCHLSHDGLDACQISGILGEYVARQADKSALAMLQEGFFNVSMVRRTFVVVFPCPYSWWLGAATLKPFRSGGKTQVTSGSVDLFPWLSDDFITQPP